MSTSIGRINFPELFFGFVAPIGADIDSTVQAFSEYFSANGYRIVSIKVTDVYRFMKKYHRPTTPLKSSPAFERYRTYIKYGNQLRSDFGDDAILSIATIVRIIKRRLRIQRETDPFEKTVYLLHQFKRKEEIDLLRSIYGRLFFQVSIYSRRGARVDSLSRLFARTEDLAGAQLYRDKAERIIQDDENEKESEHGQRVATIFHDADFFVNTDVMEPINRQVSRFCELLFGSNKISPTKIEYGMFLAKAAALRTLDLSRQVGAAIFNDAGEIVALGSNEVPKAEGGAYSCDDDHDDRDYMRGVDSNDLRKTALLSEVLKIIGLSEKDILKYIDNEKIQDSQFMDALEYGRIVHAEMSALMAAAPLGVSVRRGTLYGTAFPCHMCAKHIISAGLSRVVFLEPYPKSLASDLHSDAIQIEGGDRGKYQSYPSVQFEHFYGISPRRYRELFERGRRKGKNGKFQNYIGDPPRPIVDYKAPFYASLEGFVIEQAPQIFGRISKDVEKQDV
jgi:deoxycytidylate deaminase